MSVFIVGVQCQISLSHLKSIIPSRLVQVLISLKSFWQVGVFLEGKWVISTKLQCLKCNWYFLWVEWGYEWEWIVQTHLGMLREWECGGEGKGIIFRILGMLRILGYLRPSVTTGFPNHLFSCYMCFSKLNACGYSFIDISVVHISIICFLCIVQES